MRKTLYDIARKLNQSEEHWLLAGKLAAVLQGAMIHAHKITIYSNQKTAYKFNDIFQEYRTLKVKYRSGESLSGHVGTFSIRGVEVSIVGDPEIICNSKHYFLPVDLLFQQKINYTMDQLEIPLLPSSWLILLGLIGNDKDLAEALSETVAKADVLEKAGDLGLMFHAKPMIDSLYN